MVSRCRKEPSFCSNICNQSPVVWGNKHFSFCNVNDKLVQAAYGRTANPQVTVERNAIVGTTLATMWLNNKPQFSCFASSCSQTFTDSMLPLSHFPFLTVMYRQHDFFRMVMQRHEMHLRARNVDVWRINN